MNRGVLAGLGPGDGPDVVSGDVGQNALLSAGSRKEVAFTTTTVQAVAATDVSNYRSVAVHVISQGTSSTVSFQGSNDNANWVPVFFNRVGGVSSAADSARTSTTVSGAIFAGPLTFRYFRLNVTGISAGTTAGTIEFFSQPVQPDMQHMFLDGLNSSLAFPVSPSTFMGSGDGISTFSSVLTVGQYFWNGSTLDRVRIPVTFKTATATASGDTALWTPTSSKKFRLMRYKIEVTADAATSGGADFDVQLRDSTTALAGGAMSLYVPATSVTTTAGLFSSGWVDLGHGHLSAAANNVLNINLSAALSAGKARVVCCGIEE